LTAYYNAPVTARTSQYNEVDIASVEQRDYSHFRLTRKVGGGTFIR